MVITYVVKLQGEKQKMSNRASTLFHFSYPLINGAPRCKNNSALEWFSYGTIQLRGTNLGKSLQFYPHLRILFAHNQISCTGVRVSTLCNNLLREGLVHFLPVRSVTVSKRPLEVCGSVWKSCPGSKDPVYYSAAGRYIQHRHVLSHPNSQKNLPPKKQLTCGSLVSGCLSWTGRFDGYTEAKAATAISDGLDCQV